MEEWLLSTEVVSEHTRVGTLARRGNNNNVRSFLLLVDSIEAFTVRIRSFIAHRHTSSFQMIRLRSPEHEEDS